MIHVKDHKTRDMFNPFSYLGPRRLALLEKSWAHLFREEILHRLPVQKLFPFYDEFKGRRTKELHAMLGITIIQHMKDLTDEEAASQFAFNIQWQYALNVTESDDAFAYVCPRTIWTMRDIVAKNNLEQALFENVSDTLQRLFDLDPSTQRLDSVHIFSNMRHLGRVRLFATTIKKFLVNLKRHHPLLSASLGTELTERYLGKKSDAVFSGVKPSDSARTLQELGDDLFDLVERFKGDDAVCSMGSYQLLVRLFAEQCVVAQGTAGAVVTVKPNKDVPSNSLQNPSDPDAGYCGHKGKGFQMQVMETCSPSGEEDQLNLITYVNVEAAHESDANALLPAVENTKERGLAPATMLADTLYGSDENVETAKTHGVEVVAPAIGKCDEKKITLTDFEFSEADEILRCPAGQAPERTKIGKRGGKRATFTRSVCDRCPKQSDCPVNRGKRHCTISYDDKSLRLARRRANEKSPEFHEAYRFRAGVEATMSDLDRITGLKHLRVRGLPAVRVAATLKATGLNILRATTFKNRRTKPKEGPKGPNSNSNGAYWTVKERFRACRDLFREIWRLNFPKAYATDDFVIMPA